MTEHVDDLERALRTLEPRPVSARLRNAVEASVAKDEHEADERDGSPRWIRFAVAAAAGLLIVWTCVQQVMRDDRPIEEADDDVAAVPSLDVGRGARIELSPVKRPSMPSGRGFVHLFWRLAEADVVVRGRVERRGDALDFVVGDVLKGNLRRSYLLARNGAGARLRLAYRPFGLRDGASLVMLLTVGFVDGWPSYHVDQRVGSEGMIRYDDGVDFAVAGLSNDRAASYTGDGSAASWFETRLKSELSRSRKLHELVNAFRLPKPYYRNGGKLFWRAVGKLRTDAALAHLKKILRVESLMAGGLSDFETQRGAMVGLTWMGTKGAYDAMADYWARMARLEGNPVAASIESSVLAILASRPGIDVAAARAFLDRIEPFAGSADTRRKIVEAQAYLERRTAAARDVARREAEAGKLGR